MTETEAINLALRDYRTKWFDAWKSKDWAAVSTEWQAEYTSVAAGTFTQRLILNGSFEGGSASATKNFEQTVRLKALQDFRGELDPDYAAMLDTPARPQPPVRRGTIIRFSPQ